MLPSGQEVWHGRYAAGMPFSTLSDGVRSLRLSQATLEIEFMHQTLTKYVTPSAAKTLSELYNKISQAYARKSGDENLQTHLDGVKKTLAETRRATGIEFLCFRQTKTKDKSSAGTATPRKDRDREGARQRERDVSQNDGSSIL